MNLATVFSAVYEFVRTPQVQAHGMAVAGIVGIIVMYWHHPDTSAFLAVPGCIGAAAGSLMVHAWRGNDPTTPSDTCLKQGASNG